LAQHALELQPDYMLGLWVGGLALCGLGRNEEAIEYLERAALLSHAPFFVGILGCAYARAGRVEDARRLVGELEERGGRGEYIPAFAALAIFVGLGDLAGIRGALSKVIEEATAAFTISAICGHFLETFRTDPEIDRLHVELFDSRRP